VSGMTSFVSQVNNSNVCRHVESWSCVGVSLGWSRPLTVKPWTPGKKVSLSRYVSPIHHSEDDYHVFLVLKGSKSESKDYLRYNLVNE